jgi:multisubunit Na+/H+ antiporter MnhB subunit
MAWGGQTSGQWAGQWQGATTLAPGGVYGQASMGFTVVGLLSAGGGTVGVLQGAAAIAFTCVAVPWVPSDRFGWGAVLAGPAGAANASLGRMALRTKRWR